MTARNPYQSPVAPRFDKAIWASYEAANRAAVEQYRDMPISLGRVGNNLCQGCQRPTVSRWGLCKRCWKEARR